LPDLCGDVDKVDATCGVKPEFFAKSFHSNLLKSARERALQQITISAKMAQFYLLFYNKTVLLYFF
jgi:hypothetical protein